MYDDIVELLRRNQIQLEQISETSSDGQLDKWKLTKENGEIYYWKAPSILDGQEMYECEAECAASELAKLFGMQNVVQYQLVQGVSEITGYNKVCESKDFVGHNYFYTYASIINDIAKYHGEEKYNKVIAVNPDLQEQINNILVFDAIIANRDRHLNNLAFLDGEDGQKVVLFDNGDSLFSKLTDQGLKFALNTSFNYSKCRPFFVTVGKQLELVKFNSLRPVAFSDVTDIMGMYFKGKRLKVINEWLKLSIGKVGLLK